MASSPVSDPEKKVVHDSDGDDAVLAQLGYTQGQSDGVDIVTVANVS
jgi:hypothetical protein